MRDNSHFLLFMYLAPQEPVTPILSEIIDNILVGHISGQVRVSHARRATLLYYFSCIFHRINF